MNVEREIVAQYGGNLPEATSRISISDFKDIVIDMAHIEENLDKLMGSLDSRGVRLTEKEKQTLDFIRWKLRWIIKTKGWNYFIFTPW